MDLSVLLTPRCVYLVFMLYQTAIIESSTTTSDVSAEKLLINSLLEKYQRFGNIGRPVVNASHPVIVGFSLGLLYLKVDEEDNMLVTSAWVYYNWTDEYLKWNESDFDGVEKIMLPTEKIWTPDIKLFNTANTEELMRVESVTVNSIGNIDWVHQRRFKSSCTFEVMNFPFDNHTCHLVFGSWSLGANKLDLAFTVTGGVDTSTLPKNFEDLSQWEITHTHGTIHRKAGFSFIELSFKLRRKITFTTYILTLPAVCLHCLTLVVFALPAEDSEKPTLGLTIFGSTLVLLLILVEASPPTTKSIPLLGMFYCFTMILVVLSVFLSTFVVKLGITDRSGKKKRVPLLVKKIMFDVVAKLLWMEPLHTEISPLPVPGSVSETRTVGGPLPETSQAVTVEGPLPDTKKTATLEECHQDTRQTAATGGSHTDISQTGTVGGPLPDTSQTVTAGGSHTDTSKTVTDEGPLPDTSQTATVEGPYTDTSQTGTVGGSNPDTSQTARDEGPLPDTSQTATAPEPHTETSQTVTVKGPLPDTKQTATLEECHQDTRQTAATGGSHTDPRQTATVGGPLPDTSQTAVNPKHHSTSRDRLHVRLRAICSVLETIFMRHEMKEARESRESEIHSEWKYLASVLDRLFFILYFIAIVVSLALFFPRP